MGHGDLVQPIDGDQPTNSRIYGYKTSQMREAYRPTSVSGQVVQGSTLLLQERSKGDTRDVQPPILVHGGVPEERLVQ